MAYSFYSSFDTPVAILRPFNTYRPRQSARAVIPTIISQITAGNRKIKLGSLTPTRDFTFVQDAARGFVTAAESDQTIGQVTNIGSGFESSIGETVELIAEAMGVSIEIVSDDQRKRPKNSEVERLWACMDKAQERMGWIPEFGGREGFLKGLKLTAEWFSHPENMTHYKHDIYNI